MKLKELLEACENVYESTKVVVYQSLDDYERNTSNWDSFEIDTAKSLNWRIAKFRISIISNIIIVALA